MYVFWEFDTLNGESEHGKSKSKLFKSVVHLAVKHALTRTACNLKIPQTALIERVEDSSQVPSGRLYCKRCFK